MKRSIFTHYLEVKGIGLNNIPKEGPLIIAATHPNSFLDAIIIAVSINRPLHFLARSDVFKTKWAEKILRSMNLIPIYRLQEGVENLNKNEITFRECYKILDDNGAILIFAEGLSLIDKKLRPLKKGLARIAFGFSEQNDFKKNVKIVPLSLNYDRPTAFRSKILYGISEAINVQDFQHLYLENTNKGIIELNKQVYDELKSHTIEVEDEHLFIYKSITELDTSFQENSLARKIRIANQIKKLSKQNNEELKKIDVEAKKAFGILRKFKLNFRKLKINTGINLIVILEIFIVFPFIILAFVLNAFPFILAKRIADRKVKLIEFYASVRLVSGTVLWLLWTIAITLVGIIYHPIFIFTIPIFFFLIKFYLWYYEKIKYLRSSIRLQKLRSNTDLYEKVQLSIKNIYKLRNALNITNKEAE